MNFSEVIENLRNFYKTDNLDELSEHIGIKIEDLKNAFLNKDLKTINIFFQKNKKSLLPILRQNGKLKDEKEDKAFKYRLRKFTASSRHLSNAIVDLKEFYETDDLEFIANKIDIGLEKLSELIEVRDYDLFMEEMYLKYEERKDAIEYILLKAELRLKLQRRQLFITEETEDKYNYFLEMLKAFNKKEVEKRTLCSGLSIAKRNYQMAKGCFLVAFGIIALYFITSCILYKGAMFTAAGALRLANTVVYALICLAITFFLSSFVKNNNTVNIFVNAFGLGSAFICGVFVPRQFLADGVIAAGRFFPAYWYVNNEEAASNLSAASASSIVLNFTIQLMFALAFMVLAIVISSKKKGRN